MMFTWGQSAALWGLCTLGWCVITVASGFLWQALATAIGCLGMCLWCAHMETIDDK